MGFFEWYGIWYMCGIVGICLVSYVDDKHGLSEGHLLEYLFAAIFGVVALGFGLYAIYCELRKDT